jgi:hypothetical protein
MGAVGTFVYLTLPIPIYDFELPTAETFPAFRNL